MDFPGVPQSQIEDELVTEAYKNYSTLIVGDFFAAILLASILWNKVSNPRFVAIWFTLMFVFNHLLKAIFYLNYCQRTKQGNLPHRRFWENYFILNHLLSGILWALGGLLFLLVEDPLIRLVIFIYLTGLLGAPISKLISFHLAYISFMIPIWLVMLFLSVSILPSLSPILLPAALLYFTVMLLSAAAAHHSLIKSIYLQIYSTTLLSDLKRSEESFRNTIENAPIGMAIVSPEGKFIHANQTLQEILGYTDDELHSKNMLEITYPADIAMTNDAMSKLINGELRIAHLEKRYIRKDGSIIWSMVSSSLIRNDQGQPINFIMQMKDVSDRIQNEEKMRQLNKKTMETLNELKLLEHDENLLNKLNRSLQICVTGEEAYPRINLIAQDLFPELSGGLSVFNKSSNQMETVIQWGQDQLLPKLFSPMDCFAIREANTNLVEDPQKAVPCNHYLTLPEGGYIALPLMVQNELIGVIHLLAPKGKKLTQHQQDMATSFGNIVKLALANINLRASLSELTLHDPLTNLYNRRYLNEFLSRELVRIARKKSTLCVAMLDIDNFKQFNDTYSHLAGDEVLKSLGQLLTKYFRETDISFRFGGEEFVVVLLNITLDNAVNKMDEFREQLKNIMAYYKDRPLPNITISIGIAEAPQHGATIEEIIKAADHALYAAKEEGKDRVKAYNP
ncbi:diguanylate cyclase [Legionella fallonii]|uniref:diguanylate cyclase n=1 Tax=Legionella fallonii LLAP-10 TaxID=1212491 RepID=A0A098G6K7_9GAMM|nr:diguanylate cyclase [Legionella fallonii]CEG58123.1 PAS/GGDEF domain-containing protein [Legionella fallonii LLAP-10]